MFLKRTDIILVWLVAFLVFLLPGIMCYGDHAQPITYGRDFLYQLASSAPSNFRPRDIPDWVPTRSGGDGCGNLTESLRRRGKRGGVRQRVRRRNHRPPLPAITLGNVRSIGNKIDEIRALARFNSDFRCSSLICFTETWLKPSTPNEHLDITGFNLIRHDRSSSESNKSKGGGLCLYMNQRWCNNYTLRSTVCTPNIEMICVSFRPFYLPREFGQVHIILVYIPPDANEEIASGAIVDAVQSIETASPDSPKIILGDFNHCRLENALPNFPQFVNSATRGRNILDRCYCSVHNSYKAVIRPSIGKSDHSIVHLLPTYRQKLKTEKVKQKKVKIWDENAKENLQACFELTDWDMLISSAMSLDEAVDIVNSYILFCQDMHIGSKKIKLFPNSKPWVRKELKFLLKEKQNAFAQKDDKKLKELNQRIRREITQAKHEYKKKLENNFRSHDSRNAWRCMRTLTGTEKKQQQTAAFVADSPIATANELNKFYSRFDVDSCNHSDRVAELCAELNTDEDQPITVQLSDVARTFKRVNPRKAMGPDNICGTLLKSCAWQLAVPFRTLFQHSLEEKAIPTCWKSAIVIPVAKTQRASQLNDYRPVALTSIVMKCFERLIMQNLLPSVSSLIDNLQFAYQPKKSVNDAVLTLVHMIAQHTDKLGHYARVSFIDFSSAFNTIKVHIMIEKLRQVDVKPSLILWITDFLSNRTQQVKVHDQLSQQITLNTGSPQGCVLSALLFILYTNDCKSVNDDVTILKYADDTVIIGIINQGEENYRNELIHFSGWCKDNFLQLNAKKTKEMVFDFRKARASCMEPIQLNGEDIDIVEKYTYLGTVLDDKLSWTEQCNATVGKAQQRMYFLRKMNSFRVDRTILSLFYVSVVQSVILFNCIVWFSGCRKGDLARLEKIVKYAEKITGVRRDLKVECDNRIVQKAKDIMANCNHPLFSCYEFLRSGRRLRSLKCRTQRFKNTFIPYSIRACNQI